MTGTTAEVIDNWAPRSLSPAAAGFARCLVTSVGPKSGERAKALLFAASRLADFALGVGLELDEGALLKDSVIERFVRSRHSGSPPTRRTLRANLRFLAREHLGPSPLVLARERPKPPYREDEIARYLALADAQPTKLRRARANALICLGAGAGLIGGELRRVRGEDVSCRSAGVLVEVSSNRPRAVPVLTRYHDRLLVAAAYFGSRYLVSGKNPDSHNVTGPLICSLSGGSDLPRLETSRLRSSYLVATAGAIGLRAFMQAAGVTCSQRLGDLVSYLEDPSEEEAVTLLGGAKRP
jgi:integrase